MFVAIRDCAIYQAGWQTLQEGLGALKLDAVGVTVGRDLTIPDPAQPEGDASLPVASAAQARAAKRAYADCGACVVALFVASNLNADRLDEELEWISAIVHAGDWFGSCAVRIDAAMSGQLALPLAERISRFAASCERILQATPGAKTPIGIENHGNQGNDCRWLRGVLERLDPARVGITLDPANFYWAGTPLDRVYELVEEFAPRTVHVHCKNLSFPAHERNGSRDRFWQYAASVKPLYEGDLDQRRIVRILADAGYCKALEIEEESLAQYAPADREQVLAADARLLTDLANEFGGATALTAPRL